MGSNLPLQKTAGAWSAVRHPLAPRFAISVASSSLFSVTRGGKRVTFSLVGARSVSGVSSSGSDAIRCAEAAAGADLAYAMDESTAKGLIVLDAPPSSAPVYTWSVDAEALALRRNSFGDVKFVAGTGGSIAPGGRGTCA